MLTTYYTLGSSKVVWWRVWKRRLSQREKWGWLEFDFKIKHFIKRIWLFQPLWDYCSIVYYFLWTQLLCSFPETIWRWLDMDNLLFTHQSLKQEKEWTFLPSSLRIHLADFLKKKILKEVDNFLFQIEGRVCTWSSKKNQDEHDNQACKYFFIFSDMIKKGIV